MRFLISTMMFVLLVGSAYAEKVEMPKEELNPYMIADFIAQSQKAEKSNQVKNRYIALIYCPAQTASNSSYTDGDEEVLSVKIQREETFISVFAQGRLYLSDKKENLGSLYTIIGNKEVNDELLKSTYISAERYYGTTLKVRLSSLLSDKTIELYSDGPEALTDKHQSTSVILENCTITYYNK